MKTTEWARLALYEGLDKEATSSMMLWESAGRAIYEAQLTADQIQQLFQQIDQAKGNRTLVGKGVDAGSAVMKAYNDLKTKVANSGPIKNIDAMYDQAAEKLKQATGGDQGVMQYVQKYRDFAKKHPIAQSFIYAALIGAAGISGAGAGGAAALGLLKMTDKLLQGEKFSSAAYSGAKTGLLAYGASKLGDIVKNTFNPGTNTGDVSWYSTATGQTSAHFKNGKLVGDIIYNNQNLSPNDPGYKEAYKVIMDYAKQQGLTGAAAGNVQDIAKTSMDAFKGGGSSVAMKSARELAQAEMAQMAQNANFESRVVKGKTLSEAYVMALFSKVERLNNKMLSEGRLVDRAVLNEGLFDKFKSKPAADAASLDKPADDPTVFTSNRAKTAQPDTAPKNPGMLSRAGSAIKNVAGKAVGAVGKGLGNLAHAATTKVTGSTLQKAWEKAGRPTDSVEIEKILQAAGVNPEVVDTVFKANGVPVTLKPAEQPQGQTDGGQAPQPTPPTGQPSPGGQAPQPTPPTGQPSPGGQAPQPLGGAVPTPTPIDTGQKTAAGGLGGGLPDISNLTQPQLRQLLPKIDARIAEIGAQPQPQQGKQPSKQTQAPAVNPGTKVTVTGDNGKPAEYTRTSKGWVNSQTLKPVDPGSAAEEYLDAQSANPTDPAGKQPAAGQPKKTTKPKVKYQDQAFAKTNQPEKPAANQQSAVDTNMSTNPVNQPTTQTATADTMKAAQPKKTTATTQPLKVSAQRNPGLPTSDEMAKYQEKLKAAMAAQDKQQGVF